MNTLNSLRRKCNNLRTSLFAAHENGSINSIVSCNAAYIAAREELQNYTNAAIQAHTRAASAALNFGNVKEAKKQLARSLTLADSLYRY